MRRDRQRVLITGAGSGIGRALAIEGARRGLLIALCGRRQGALEETSVLISSESQAEIVAADITDPTDRKRLVDHIGKAWGRVDVLINNAGLVEGGALEQTDDAALERIFRTNVIAHMALTRDLLPLLKAAPEGRVVNVGSIFGDIPYPQFAAYSASKFALRGFSIALRREWRDRGIRVTYVAPRATKTAAAVAFDALIAKSGMRLDPPERVARYVWKAVLDGRDSIYAPGPEKFFVLLQRTVPQLIDWALAR